MDLKLEKWEPERIGRIPDGHVSVYEKGISVPKWAWENLSEMVNLYYDLEAKVIGVKPGNLRKLKQPPSQARSSRVKYISCEPLIKKFGVKKRILAKAEWSKKHGMLLIHLEGA